MDWCLAGFYLQTKNRREKKIKATNYGLRCIKHIKIFFSTCKTNFIAPRNITYMNFDLSQTHNAQAFKQGQVYQLTWQGSCAHPAYLPHSLQSKKSWTVCPQKHLGKSYTDKQSTAVNWTI